MIDESYFSPKDHEENSKPEWDEGAFVAENSQNEQQQPLVSPAMPPVNGQLPYVIMIPPGGSPGPFPPPPGLQPPPPSFRRPERRASSSQTKAPNFRGFPGNAEVLDDSKEAEAASYSPKSYPSPRQKKWQVKALAYGALVFALAGSAVAGFLAINDNPPAPVADDPAASADLPPKPLATTTVVSVPQTVEELVQAYANLNGGRANLAGLTSLRRAGSASLNQQTFEFDQVKVPGRRAWLKLERNGQSLVVTVNGAHTWRKIVSPTGQSSVSELVGEEALNYSSLTHFFNPVAQHALSDDQELRIIGFPNADNQHELVLEYHRDGNERGELFLDKETLRIRRQDRWVDGQKVSSTRYRDYRPVNDVWLPHRIDVVNADGNETGISVSEAEFNVGVLSTIFEKPKL